MIRLLAILLLALAVTGPAQAIPLDERASAIRNEIMVDPNQALADSLALRATTSRNATPERRTRAVATADWLRAEALIGLDRPAQALIVIQGALNSLSPFNDNFDLKGELVLARGGVSALLGHVQDALRDYQLAYRLFGIGKDGRGAAKALLNLGTLYSDAGDNETALRYFQQATDASAADARLLFSAQNNSGNVLFALKRYTAAENAYQKALTLVRGDPLLESLILRNLASTQAEAHEFDAANATLGHAFQISASGAASSGRPALYGVAAFVALREHQLDKAATWIDRAFAESGNAQASLPLRDFHRTAYEIFSARGETVKALQHLEAFRKLDDRQRAVTMSTNAALLNARFNFANQEVKIKNLQLDQYAAAERFRNVLTKGLLSVAAIISTLLLIGFLSIRRSRNQVRAANATLRTTNVALEKALAAKTEFLATTSHEIRTPLNGILGMTQVILAGRSIDPTLRSRIELVHGAGETMKALVDDILDVAKMETGELRIQTAEMDLKRLLGDAVQVWTGQAETKRIGIEFDLDHCPGKIIADEVRLRQIVFNLMSNAIKFTDRGQVRLAAFAEPEDADDEENKRERLVIRVADSGIGVPQDRLEDIFESFRQVDGGVTRRHGGTGLGLAICRSLARAMGGDVEVTSVLGTGSTFTLVLPLKRGAAEIAREDRVAATSLATAELLMIEPNPLGQGIMRALLAGECASVQFVIDVPGAVQALGTGAIDHVVAEGSALGLDPVAAGQLAAACAAAGARFTLLWRAPDSALLTAFRDNGVTHVVAKPISAPDLLSEMNRVYGEPIASRDIAA